MISYETEVNPGKTHKYCNATLATASLLFNPTLCTIGTCPARTVLATRHVGFEVEELACRTYTCSWHTIKCHRYWWSRISHVDFKSLPLNSMQQTCNNVNDWPLSNQRLAQHINEAYSRRVLQRHTIQCTIIRPICKQLINWVYKVINIGLLLKLRSNNWKLPKETIFKIHYLIGSSCILFCDFLAS